MDFIKFAGFVDSAQCIFFPHILLSTAGNFPNIKKGKVTGLWNRHHILECLNLHCI